MCPNSAGEAVGAFLQAPLGDDAAPDARAEGDHEHLVGSPGGPEDPLGPARAAGVVGDPDGRTGDTGVEPGPHGQSDDSREVRGEAEHAVAVDQPGGADADAQAGGPRGQLGDHRRHRVEQILAAVGVSGLGPCHPPTPSRSRTTPRILVPPTSTPMVSPALTVIMMLPTKGAAHW